MATRKKEVEYEYQGVPTEISATSRCAIKINDNFYTIEAMEKRAILNPELADMDREWADLFDTLNSIADKQVEEILTTFKIKK